MVNSEQTRSYRFSVLSLWSESRKHRAAFLLACALLWGPLRGPGRKRERQRTDDSNRAYAAFTAPFFRCRLWVPVTSRCGVYGAGCLGKDGHAGAVGRVDGAHHLPHRALAAEAPVRAHAVPPAGPQILRAAGKFTVIESERTAPPPRDCCYKVLPESASQSISFQLETLPVGGMGERRRFGA